jgi:hypothetical protein
MNEIENIERIIYEPLKLNRGELASPHIYAFKGLTLVRLQQEAER